MAALTAGDLTKIAKAAYKRVAQKATTKPDRQKRPFLRWLESMRKETTFEGGALVYPVQKSFADNGTTWGGDDTIAAIDPDFQYNMEFGYFNFSTAVTIKHDALTRMGFSVEPNAQGTLMDRIKSKDDAFKIINWIENMLEGFEDNHDRRLDELLHFDGTAAVTDPVGLYGILGLANTTGTVGGVSRVTETTVRHYVDLTISTPAAGSDFREKLGKAKRLTDQYGGENGIPGSIDMLFVGSAFLDGYKKWGELNNYRITRSIGEVKSMKFDFAIPDDAVFYEGLPMIWDPTLEKMDIASPATTPDFTKHCVGLNSKTWKYRSLTGKYKKLTSPPDPSNQRISRSDIDSTASLGCNAPAGNFLVSMA
jgi:hypothetical protein